MIRYCALEKDHYVGKSCEVWKRCDGANRIAFKAALYALMFVMSNM